MDNLTHSLFGLTLARTSLRRAGRGTSAALILSSNAPDIDIVCTAGGALKYLEWHRGPTHGPLGVVILGCATAGLVCAGRAWLDKRAADRSPLDAPARTTPNASFATLALVSIVGVLLHICLDLPTSYGTRFLSPFDWRWFAVDLMPIIDVYLLAALGAGLLFGRGSETAGRRTAAIVLLVMGGNYGMRTVSHQRALDLAPAALGALPPACDNLDRHAVLDRWPAMGSSMGEAPEPRCLREIAAIPTFGSPFQWRVVAQLSDAYEVLDLNVLTARARAPATEDTSTRHWRQAERFSNQWTPAVVAASAADAARVFLDFSRFPAARSRIEPDRSTLVQWTDIRFMNPPSSTPGPREGFFAVSVRVGPDGQIVNARLGN